MASNRTNGSGSYAMTTSQRIRPAARNLATFSLLIAVNIVLWIWTLQALKGHPELLGTALLSYVFGLRHAFDPDHIAAIDNVVRKLMQDQKPSTLVGFYFALGHSSIVMLASVAISGTALSFDVSALGDFNLVRTLVSAFFLLAIGLANYFILRSIWATFVRVSRGEQVSSEQFDPLMSTQGPLSRLFRPLFNIVTRSWHMFPVGFMFGLGFDTATEIGLFGISATQAAQGTSFWTILLFPLLFAAGNDAGGHGRQRLDDERLRLGVRKAHPQALVQFDPDNRIRALRNRYWRARSAWLAERPARSGQWSGEHCPKLERSYGQSRLYRCRDLRPELDLLCITLSFLAL
jgi:high-affinity nickel permease